MFLYNFEWNSRSQNHEWGFYFPSYAIFHEMVAHSSDHALTTSYEISVWLEEGIRFMKSHFKLAIIILRKCHLRQ